MITMFQLFAIDEIILRPFSGGDCICYYIKNYRIVRDMITMFQLFAIDEIAARFSYGGDFLCGCQEGVSDI